ncbi:Regulatory protein BlaR1 [Stieleria maiorica]|uniref:Regulatory protein BlaR1 n=1 Tax=Stieleria maiorica TaxID=2795974 RepID=A0A5B9MA94_9BACT|nr:M56 family metallopeptidase [Stieleria maiorica]QEF96445.1 Regulatory protein BlaR1 [Stieleria maiorica]
MSVFDVSWMGGLVLHVTVILGVAIGFDMAAARLAALRHWINVAAIVLILAAPISIVLLQRLDPGWLRVSWAGPSRSAAESAPVEPAVMEQPTPTTHQNSPDNVTDQADDSPIIAALAESPIERTDLRDDVSLATPSAPLAQRPDVQSATPAPETQSRWVDWMHALTPFASATWFLGGLVLLIRMTVSLLRVRLLLQRARPVCDSGALDVFAEACKHLGADKHRIALATSDRTDTPLATGILRPCIVLPAEMPGTATRQQLLEVLIHELAHVARRDQMVVLLQHLAAALYWWHPLVHRVNRRLGQAREDVCDNHVLAVTDGVQYSQTLLDIAQRRSGHGAPMVVAGLFSSQWKLEHRIASLLDRRRNRSTRVSTRGWIAVAMATCIAVGLGSLASMAWGIENPQTPTNQPTAEPVSAETDDADSDPIETKTGDTEPDTPIQGTVHNEDGQPIADATVLLVYRVGEDRQLHRTTSKTDRSGRYRFGDLPVGSSELPYISIRVHASGYAIGQQNVTRYLSQPDSFTELEDIDVSLVAADACVVDVVNEQGEPVSDVLVEQINTNGDHASNLYIFPEDWAAFDLESPRSNAAGRLTIPSIDRSRNYDLRLSHPQYAATPVWEVEFGNEPLRAVIEKGNAVRFVVTCKSDPDLIDQATIEATVSEDGGHSVLTFDVDASGVVQGRLRDRHTTINIAHPTLEGLPWYFYRPAEPEMPFTLHRTGVVEGTVVHATSGQGVANVSVRFVQDNRVIKQVGTDADGRYQCTLAEGEYRVSVDMASGKWKSSETEVSVEVAASNTTSIEPLSVQPESMIRGRVVLASGEGVPSAIIVPHLRESPVIADENGDFELEPSRRMRTIQAFHPHQRLSRVVAAPTDGQDLRIRLAPEGVLTGVLRDRAGKTLSGVPVGLGVRSGNLGGRARSSFRTTLLRDFTDEYGFVRFAGLSEGLEYGLAVEGSSRARFGDRTVSRSDWHTVPNLPAAPIEIEVSPDLIAQLETVSSYREAPLEIQPFGQVDWFDGRRLDVDALRGQFVLISFVWHPGQFAETQLCQQIYGDQGLDVVGVVSSQQAGSPATKRLLEKNDFPIAIDNPQARVTERYGQSDGIGSIIYDRAGKRVRTIRRSDNLLPILRSIMLYDERLQQ